MMSRRICLRKGENVNHASFDGVEKKYMFVIIKKGENVNVCIHDFDDVKRRIKQGSFCFKINTRLFQQTKP